MCLHVCAWGCVDVSVHACLHECACVCFLLNCVNAVPSCVCVLVKSISLCWQHQPRWMIIRWMYLNTDGHIISSHGGMYTA